MVNVAKKHVFKGDIFQVVLSQRFKTKFNLPPFELYRILEKFKSVTFSFFS